MPLGAISRKILAQNAGRDPVRTAAKLRLMRRDAFAFFRGSNRLFLEFLPRRHPLFDAPATLVCGDLHMENFGAFKGDNRLCYFDVNDFDEACAAPFTVDIVRFLACIDVAAGPLSLSRKRAAALGDEFLSAYCAAIADGKPRWLERSLATGVFKRLLRRAMRRTRAQLLDRFSRQKGGKRRMRLDTARMLPLVPGELDSLRRFIADFARSRPNPKFYGLIDAARRVAGNGSLGLARYTLLVRGRGSPNQNFALDLKFAAPSAVAAWLGRPQPQWPSESARVAAIQRILQAIPPAMLHAVRYQGRPFILKELQPSVDRLQFSDWGRRSRRMREAMQGMGRVAAWAHLRGCGHYGCASIEALQSFVAAGRWQAQARRQAGEAAARIERAWRSYSRDYDGGRIRGVPQAI